MAQGSVHLRGVGIYATDESTDGTEARLTVGQGRDGAGKGWTENEKNEGRKQLREYVSVKFWRLVRQFLSHIIPERYIGCYTVRKDTR